MYGFGQWSKQRTWWLWKVCFVSSLWQDNEDPMLTRFYRPIGFYRKDDIRSAADSAWPIISIRHQWPASSTTARFTLLTLYFADHSTAIRSFHYFASCPLIRLYTLWLFGPWLCLIGLYVQSYPSILAHLWTPLSTLEPKRPDLLCSVYALAGRSGLENGSRSMAHSIVVVAVVSTVIIDIIIIIAITTIAHTEGSASYKQLDIGYPSKEDLWRQRLLECVVSAIW